MAAVLLCAFMTAAAAAGAATSVAPPAPGALPTPPAGWRSWNQMGGDISQALMTDMMTAMADRSRTVQGKPTSLIDLGYNRIGMDDNWQACGAGVNGSFHDASGNPIFNATRFPDVRPASVRHFLTCRRLARDLSHTTLRWPTGEGHERARPFAWAEE